MLQSKKRNLEVFTMKDWSKILKLFPLMPKKGDTKKLILTIALYIVAVSVASAVVDTLLFATLLLYPLSTLVGFVMAIYMEVAIVFAVLNYLGVKITFEDNSDEY